MSRIFLGGRLGLAIAVAFAASAARSIDIGRDIALVSASLPPSPGGRDHFRTIQARHDFSQSQYVQPHLKGRAPRFHRYAHF